MEPLNKNFDFNLRRDNHKNFLWASRLWVGRRKDPILGYVLKNYEKKNSGGKGFLRQVIKFLHACSVPVYCTSLALELNLGTSGQLHASSEEVLMSLTLRDWFLMIELHLSLNLMIELILFYSYTVIQNW